MDELISLTPLKIITLERGDVLHAIKRGDSGFVEFGEVYFSQIKPNAIKAWKRHLEMTLNLVVPVGTVRFVLCDDRYRGEKKIEVVTLSKENYQRLTVPPMIWVGFQGLDEEVSTILNVADIAHRAEESESKCVSEIEFDWSK